MFLKPAADMLMQRCLRNMPRRDVNDGTKWNPLVKPAAQVGSGDGLADVVAVFSCVVAGLGVVAHGILVHVGSGSICQFHLSAAVVGDTTNLGGLLPEHCGKMSDAVENTLRDVGRTPVRGHSLELALVPAFGDTSSHIERVAGDGEEILALASTIRNVVIKYALLCGEESVSFARSVPHEG